MKTLRPRIKVYIVSLLALTLLFLLVCIPLFLSGFILAEQMILIAVAAAIGHLIASLPFSPNLLRMPAKKPKPSQNNSSHSGVTGHDACTLYVGNLLYRTKRDDLVRLFSKFGEVSSARIILDKDSRKSKGYGFVEMAQQDAQSAVAALNGSELNGRALRVNEAKGR